MNGKIRVPGRVFSDRKWNEYAIPSVLGSLLILVSYLASGSLIPVAVIAAMIFILGYAVSVKGKNSVRSDFDDIVRHNDHCSIFTFHGNGYVAFQLQSLGRGILPESELMAQLSRLESMLNSLTAPAFVTLEPLSPEEKFSRINGIEKSILYSSVMFALIIIVRENDANTVEKTMLSDGFIVSPPDGEQIGRILQHSVRSGRSKRYGFTDSNNCESSRSIEDFRNLDSEFWKFLTSLNLPFSYTIAMYPEKAENAGKGLRRMLAEHNAMMRLNAHRKGRIAEIQRKKEDTEMLLTRISQGKRIFRVSGALRIYSSHPVMLKRLDAVIHNYTALRNGSALSMPHASSSNLFTGHSNYFLDSLSIASLIHVPQKINLDGVFIGIDIDQGKPYFMDIFSAESYNMVILGQTGSGKSYFARTLLRRLIISGTVSRAMILDPLGEYEPSQFGSEGVSSACLGIDELEEYSGCYDERGKGTLYERVLPRISVIRTENSIEMQQHTQRLGLMIERWMSEYSSERKAIIVDEAHLLMVNPDGRKFLDTIVRHSRHYSTSVITISQNLEDFMKGSMNRSILSNSRHIFLFRSTAAGREIRELVPDDVQIPEVSELPGGKNSQYSECLYRGDGTRHLRILPLEKEEIQEV